jgi:hypothetical protein
MAPVFGGGGGRGAESLLTDPRPAPQSAARINRGLLDRGLVTRIAGLFFLGARMAWENDLIRTTNEIARLNRRGGRQALARAARELCTAYSNLLTDSGFAQSIQRTLQRASSPGFEATTLRSHVNTAIALLVAAGVDGEQAVAALRSIQNPPPTPSIAGQTDDARPSVVTLPEPEKFFELLRDAKDTACELSRLHGERASGRRRRLGFAAVGLALVGLSVAPVAVPVVAATGVAAAGVAGVCHILGAVGALIFVHNVNEAITAPTQAGRPPLAPSPSAPQVPPAPINPGAPAPPLAR